MITFIPSPPSCKFSEPYTHVVKDKKDQTVFFNGKALKLVGLTADHITADALFTKVKRSNIKNIDVTGSVYLQNCEVSKVTATKDIFIFGCKKIDDIVAGGSVHIVHLPQEISPRVTWLNIKAGKINQYYLLNEPSNFLTIENCSGDHFNLDPYIKYVELKGDCSKISEIVFSGALYSPMERFVILRNGTFFKGRVIGGKLVTEDVFKKALSMALIGSKQS